MVLQCCLSKSSRDLISAVQGSVSASRCLYPVKDELTFKSCGFSLIRSSNSATLSLFCTLIGFFCLLGPALGKDDNLAFAMVFSRRPKYTEMSTILILHLMLHCKRFEELIPLDPEYKTRPARPARMLKCPFPRHCHQSLHLLSARF